MKEVALAARAIDAPILSGHRALDLLDTRFRYGDELLDALQSDEDVLDWRWCSAATCGNKHE